MLLHNAVVLYSGGLYFDYNLGGEREQAPYLDDVYGSCVCPYVRMCPLNTYMYVRGLLHSLTHTIDIWPYETG